MTRDQQHDHRRWYRFGLRTLFVAVTVLAVPLVWLASEWRFVLERKVVASEFSDRIGPLPYVGPFFDPGPTIPFWRHWLGDTPYHSIDVPPDATAVDIQSAERLFPEAKIYSAPPRTTQP